MNDKTEISTEARECAAKLASDSAHIPIIAPIIQEAMNKVQCDLKTMDGLLENSNKRGRDLIDEINILKSENARLTKACEKEFASVVVLNDLTEKLRTEIEELRKDKERLDWILKLIFEHGISGLLKIKWTNPADIDPLLEDEVFFDRPAIDAAMNQQNEN